MNNLQRTPVGQHTYHDHGLAHSNTSRRKRLRATNPRQVQQGHLLDVFVKEERLAWLDGGDTETEELEDSPLFQPESAKQENSHQRAKMTADGSPVKNKLLEKSSFIEGSMTANSKAVASTWHSAAVSIQEEDDEITPRELPRSRCSISSSIDINEFKPLPATPVTIKTTVRRIGDKFKTQKVQKAQTRGCRNTGERLSLRSSISSFNIFNNDSISDQDSIMSGSTATTQASVNTQGSRTPKFLKSFMRKSPVKRAQPDFTLMEDRKRKAAVAYDQQFGQKAKKSKSNFVTDTVKSFTHHNNTQLLRESYEEDADATIRPSSRKVSTRSSPSNFPADPASQAYGELQERSDIAIDQNLNGLPSVPSNTSFSNISRHLDYAKLPSRSELAKENQQLRSMLHGKTTHVHKKRASRDQYEYEQLQAGRERLNVTNLRSQGSIGDEEMGTRSEQETPRVSGGLPYSAIMEVASSLVDASTNATKQSFGTSLDSRLNLSFPKQRQEPSQVDSRPRGPRPQASFPRVLPAVFEENSDEEAAAADMDVKSQDGNQHTANKYDGASERSETVSKTAMKGVKDTLLDNEWPDCVF